MGEFRTRGQPSAAGAVRTMLDAHVPHALLFVGPAGTGKTTLGLDLAAGLLCMAPAPAVRPCRECRGCRLVESGNHPDLHRLAPEGAGRQIAIGNALHPEPGTVRHLVGELALLPVEGGARVALVEDAGRMNEDAQNALLKTLEEPPGNVTIILCAEDEERLLPTVRSRCARVRLGPVRGRAIEGLLEERGAADPPTAARLARLARGRPGLALAYALAPDAASARLEIARSLIDLASADAGARLASIRALLVRAAELQDALARPTGPEVARPGRVTRGARRRGAPPPSVDVAAGPAALDGAPDSSQHEEAEAQESAPSPEPGGTGRAAPAERRRAALALLDVWLDLARDIALVARGGPRAVHDPVLLDEIEELARRVDPDETTTFLSRAGATAGLVEANANPELALDVLALAWPRPSASVG